ncbi:MAG: hypothetical protein R3E84_04375 [Pseudomonadales bacterium]
MVPNTATQSPSPTTAQFAVQQARLLADNLLACLAERPPRSFHYKARASCRGRTPQGGRGNLGVRLAGFAAWLLWRLYLARIPTFAWKVAVPGMELVVVLSYKDISS